MDKYINVHYSGSVDRYTAKAVYQYDHGKTLRIYNIESSATVQVQYSILGMKKSITDVPVYQDGAWVTVVPGALLAQPNEIQAYVYVSGDSYGQTIIHVSIPITARAKPEGYAYTEEEIKGLEYVLSQLSAAIEEVEALKSGTQAATDNANAAASSANTEAANANKAATNATTAASNADAAAAKVSNITASATSLSSDQEATAKVSSTANALSLEFGIPEGKQGETGNSGVHMGSEEPTDEDVDVWINPDEEPQTLQEAVSAHMESQYVHTIECLQRDGELVTFLVYGVIE